MFKKLLVFVALVAVGAASYLGARAYFSSEDPATETATFNAGTISINLAKHDGYNEVPFVLNNWMPGQEQDVVFDVVNTSTVPVTLSGEVNGTWGGDLGDQMVYVLSANYWSDSAGDWLSLNHTGHGTFTYDNPIAANGGILTIKMRAQFDPAAGNDFQGKTYTATLNVTAHQVE